MSIEARRIGYQAEQRVVEISSRHGLNARMATLAEDHAGKTDVFIENKPFQVSCGKKSRGELKRLGKRGIETVTAGENIPEEKVFASIMSALDRS